MNENGKVIMKASYTTYVFDNISFNVFIMFHGLFIFSSTKQNILIFLESMQALVIISQKTNIINSLFSY